MENPTYIALSKLMTQQRLMDVIANNVANSNTPGYKTQHVLFSDWLLPTQGSSGNDREIAFSQDRATWRDLSSGSIEHTGDPLDLALGGTGYFSVGTSAGVRLTRSGRFALAQDGSVVDSQGNGLLDTNGSPIVLPNGKGAISIAGDGTISAGDAVVAKIGVVTPGDGNRLVPEGSHLLRSDGDTAPVDRPGVIQGAIESSNVSTMLELTEMMQNERQFQFVAQFTEAESTRQQNTIDRLSAEPQV